MIHKITIQVYSPGITKVDTDYTVPRSYFVTSFVREELKMLIEVVSRLCGIKSREIGVSLEEPDVAKETECADLFFMFTGAEFSKYDLDAEELKSEFLEVCEHLKPLSFAICLPSLSTDSNESSSYSEHLPYCELRNPTHT